MHDAAWALEEGLKSLTLVAALGQAEIMAELAARRLGLAAQASRTPCLLISGIGTRGCPGRSPAGASRRVEAPPPPLMPHAPGAARLARHP